MSRARHRGGRRPYVTAIRDLLPGRSAPIRAPDKVLALVQALYQNQPAEGSAGLSEGDIATRALSAGVPQSVVDTFGQLTFEPWIAKFTTAAFSGGITGTPTVKINGTQFQGDLYTVGPLTQAITTAKGQP